MNFLRTNTSRSKSIFIFIVVLSVLVVFRKSFSIFFVQDDFFLLRISHIDTFRDFFSFFIPLKTVVWYRPLSSQIFFFLGQFLFGLNPVFYHAIVFATHFSTGFLLFVLTKSLTKQEILAVLSALFYLLHAAHTVSLSWLATYSFILGPFFVLATTILYRKKLYILSFVLFLLGILTTEVLVIFPLILLGYQKLFENKIAIVKMAPYTLVGFGIVALRFILFPTEVASNSYTLNFSLALVDTARFYTLRLFGVPLFVRTMPILFQLIVFSFAAIFTMGIILGGITVLRNIKNQPRWFLFYIIIAVVGLIPFITLPAHTSPHYLSFSLLGAAPVFVYLLLSVIQMFLKRVRFTILFALVSIFVLLQVFGALWTYQTHWIFKRAELAEKLVTQKNLSHPIRSEEYFSLGANEALHVFQN